MGPSSVAEMQPLKGRCDVSVTGPAGPVDVLDARSRIQRQSACSRLVPTLLRGGVQFPAVAF